MGKDQLRPFGRIGGIVGRSRRPRLNLTQQTIIRTKADLEAALESLLYEMLMLASALLVRDTRYFFKKYDGLAYGPP